MDALQTSLVQKASMDATKDYFGTEIYNMILKQFPLPTFDQAVNFAGAILKPAPGAGTIDSSFVVDYIVRVNALTKITQLNVDNWYRVVATQPPYVGSLINLANFTQLEVLSCVGSLANPNRNLCFGTLAYPNNLKVLNLYGNGNNELIPGATNFITADLSLCTKLETVNLFGFLRFPLPNWGSNANLVDLTLGGHHSDAHIATSVQNMRFNLKLKTFADNGTSNMSAATVNKILAELKIAKQNGGALTSLNLAGGAAPTGQGLTDKAALQGLGVQVTTK